MAETLINSVASETTASGPSIDAAEVAQFSALAHKWWDTRGEFAPLHRFNPTRVAFIRRTCLDHFGRDEKARRAFETLSLLDVGCGGGLLSEPMRRMGFSVTGLDASAENIAAARRHAGEGALDIRYLNQTVEQLAEAGEVVYDVVLCMEVIEHVADPESFLKVCAALVKPGGILFLATINRTLKSKLLAIGMAEYVLNWVPRGTHDWQKFLSPGEVVTFLDGTPLLTDPAVGVGYDVLSGQWGLSDDSDVNYMMVARNPPRPD